MLDFFKKRVPSPAKPIAASPKVPSARVFKSMARNALKGKYLKTLFSSFSYISILSVFVSFFLSFFITLSIHVSYFDFEQEQIIIDDIGSFIAFCGLGIAGFLDFFLFIIAWILSTILFTILIYRYIFIPFLTYHFRVKHAGVYIRLYPQNPLSTISTPPSKRYFNNLKIYLLMLCKKLLWFLPATGSVILALFLLCYLQFHFLSFACIFIIPLIVFGILKTLPYSIIPYITADKPNITPKESFVFFNIIKKKYKRLFLRVVFSFSGFALLILFASLFCGAISDYPIVSLLLIFSSVFFLCPYYKATIAAFYTYAKTSIVNEKDCKDDHLPKV